MRPPVSLPNTAERTRPAPQAAARHHALYIFFCVISNTWSEFIDFLKVVLLTSSLVAVTWRFLAALFRGGPRTSSQFRSEHGHQVLPVVPGQLFLQKGKSDPSESKARRTAIFRARYPLAEVCFCGTVYAAMPFPVHLPPRGLCMRAKPRSQKGSRLPSALVFPPLLPPWPELFANHEILVTGHSILTVLTIVLVEEGTSESFFLKSRGENLWHSKG